MIYDGTKKEGIKQLEGKTIIWKDKDGNYQTGTVRIKEVRCGKKNCRACPHRIYAYAQYRKGKKVTEKYLGVAR
jgi:hypothetical protein